MTRTRSLQSGAHPTAQEIRDYLDGMNRTESSMILTCDTERLRAYAISNYRKWFKRHGIAIHQEPKTLIWKLGEVPYADASRSDGPEG